MKPTCLVVLGPTASGKTRLATRLAALYDGEILSVDSRQVFRGMNLGTGKDYDEYVVDGKPVPYHLIDIVDPGETYHIYQFQQDFTKAYTDILERKKLPVICGGTGLYLEAVLNNHQFTGIPVDIQLREELGESTDEELRRRFLALSSEYHERADLSTRKRTIRAIEIAEYLRVHPMPEAERPVPVPLVFGLNPPVERRRERIDRRLETRLNEGLIEEVQTLLAQGVSAEKLIFYGLEYKFVTEYLTGVLDRQTMTDRLRVAIHQFAKRQMTFFRKMERDGLAIHWLSDEIDAQLRAAEKLIRENGLDNLSFL